MINLYPLSKVIASLAGFYTFLVVLLFTFSDVSISLIDAFKYVALFELFISIIFLFGWEYIWKFIPPLNKWLFPNINGTWDVEIHWNLTKEDKKIKKGIKKGEVFIKQNLLSLSMELITDESESETLAVQPKKNAESGRLQLYYIYRNTPQNNGELKTHIGTAILKLSHKSNSLLEGNYFTDRNTKGILKFIKQE